MYANRDFGTFLPQHQTSCDTMNHFVMRQMTENDGAGDSGLLDKTKLIVNYIPQFTTEEDLATIFAKIGPLESIRIMRDNRTGYSYGFGFVKYTVADHAAKAIETINGLTFRSKRLKVSYSRPPGQDMKDSNLYITNLPRNVSEEDIDKLFGDYGEIVQRTVLKDKITGMPRGVAFVRFSKGEEAQSAIIGLDGKQLENSLFPLSVRVADDHGRQKAHYIDMWNQMRLYNRGGFNPLRSGVPCIRDITVARGNLTNRGIRYPATNFNSNNRYVGMGAGDNPYQNQLFW